MAEKLHKGHLPLLMQPPQGDGHKPIKCRVGEENGMIARIIRTILQYPVGAEVGFTDEFTTEYRTVTGYQYSHGAFYVIFSERSMVHMNRLDKLVVSVKIKRRARDASKQKSD